WRVVGGFEERSYGRCRDGLGFDAAEAFEGAGVGGGVVAARLPRNGFRHIRLQFGCTRPRERAGLGARCRGCASGWSVLRRTRRRTARVREALSPRRGWRSVRCGAPS